MRRAGLTDTAIPPSQSSSTSTEVRVASKRLTLHLDAPSNVLPCLKVFIIHLAATLIGQTFDVHDDLPFEAVTADRERLVRVRRDGKEVLFARRWADSDAKLGHF